MIQGPLKIEQGDRLILKKKHPCGSFEWEVVRIGADIRIRCVLCDHLVMIERSELRKKVKKIVVKKAEI
jgi:hypothetical protein